MNEIPIAQAFLGGIVAYAAAGLFGLAAARQRRLVIPVVFALTTVGAVLEGAASLAAIGAAQETVIAVPFRTFFVQYTFRLDPVAAYFSLALAVVGFAVSIFSFGYVRGFDSRKPVGVFCFL